MCRPDEKSYSSPPPDLQVESDLSASDGSESDGTNEATMRDNSTSERRRQRKMRQLFRKQQGNDMKSHAETSPLSSIASGALHGVVWLLFSLNFPLFCNGREMGKIIYQTASFEYDPAISLFDNTIWTYGTDYALAAITSSFALWIIRTSNRSSNKRHKRLARISASMLILYAISTGAGAIAHQYFLTVESRNTMAFRLLWTTCVGTVYLAPIAMGMIGNECLRIFQPRPNCPPVLKAIPRLTDTYWIFYGGLTTSACILGYTSFQRPACDIFAAGITQSPCTFYFMAFLHLVNQPGITRGTKNRGLFGFIINAFLLPLYPILVVNLGWSLAAANTLLHCNLCLAWSLQGLTLQKIVKSLVEESNEDALTSAHKKVC